MKRYSISVVLHILLLVVLSIGGYLLFCYELWFSTLIVGILLIATGVHLYSIQMKLAGMMRRLTDCIRFNDMTQNFQPPFKSKMMVELADELSQTLRLFRGRLLEEEIKHQYYENLLNKVDTAVVVTDRSGRVEWMNRAAVALVGQESRLPQEWLTTSWNETQVVRIRQQGASVEMAVSCTLFAAQNKERLLVSLKNIHSVLDSQETEAWQKLIRVLTHEIMNSITPVTSLSELLEHQIEDFDGNEEERAEIRRMLQTIRRRGDGLIRFVNSYREVSHLPQPLLKIYTSQELLTGVVRLMYREPNDLHLILPPKGQRLMADKDLIEQVLINLIKNARENDATDIRISAGLSSGERPYIRIEDNGTGIEQEVLDRIFIPFFTTKPTGSGIGLTISRQIMHLHRGTITVSSEPGKGSIFTLLFPGVF